MQSQAIPLFCLGQFVFAHDTLGLESLQRNAEWRHASNSRVTVRPASQYLGPGDETITLPGAAVPEIGHRRSAIQTLRGMADTGAAYVLADGDGYTYGTYVITTITDESSHFVSGGLPRKTTFSLTLKRVDDSLADPTGGADDDASTGWDGFDLWDWWLG